MNIEIVPPANVFDRLNRWIRESTTVKLGSIGFLVLMLLIPQSWIESLIVERQNRAGAVINEIADKWSGEQTVAGPALVIPYIRREKIDKGKDGVEIREYKEQAFFLPEQLKIDGKVNPQVLHRGIFESAVYESALKINADFNLPDFKKLNIADADVLWSEAHLAMGISDLRGINENPKLKMGDQLLTGEPSNNIGLAFGHPETLTTNETGEYRALPASPPSPTHENGIIMRLPWKSAADFKSVASVDINLKGSTLLYFSPLGKTTEVSVKGAWPSPSFDGEFLPSQRDITEKGFDAKWKVLHYNRPFAQEWVGDQTTAGSEFGVRLLIPVDQYQKSIRTAKYGVLVILLTFISLFMVEIMRKIRIHPFQYILIGASLIIYYSLLLSFSEHLGYDWAYVISTIATVTLITLYSITFLRSKQSTTLFGALLTSFYAFIFVIIQQQDYSLTLGSIGLFFIIGVIMYCSRNINWYKESAV